MVKDMYGKEINIGDRFRYQPNTAHEHIGSLIDDNGVPTIQWDGESELIPLGDFWYRTDSKITIKI